MRKIFKKGFIYEALGASEQMIVMCTETTCSISSRKFKGVCIYIPQTRETTGAVVECICDRFVECKETVIIGNNF